MRIKRIIITALALFAWLNIVAIDISIDINPQNWQNAIRGEQGAILLEAGQPMLPYLPIRVLLPFGEKLEGFQISYSDSRLQAENASIPIARPQQPISINVVSAYSAPTLENRLYPNKDYEYLGTQYYRGYQIALFNLYPYKYNPLTRKLFAVSSANISIESRFSNTEATYQANFLTPNEETLATLTGMAANPETLSSYNTANSYRNVTNQSRTIDLTQPKKMIIITDNQRVSWFEDYAAWRTEQGISNAIYTMEDIIANYPGTDNAMKLRNFIIDVYQTWAISSEPLQYVILGGDDEIIPVRGAYGEVGDTIDLYMPVDIYYSNLDGNWNANQNAIYGEVADNTDLIPEIHIGRFPAETISEFQNIFRKTQYYAETNSFSNNLVLFTGENLNMNPVTWGGDYKDDIVQYLPNGYNLETLYQRDGTYNSGAVLGAINSGAAIMNHMGHSNETSLMGQSNTSVGNMTNSEYGFLFSQGCYPAAFDQRTSGDGEAIGEHLLTANGALFAFVGNTRYGWYMPGSIEGASQFYDRQFFNGLFANNQPQLGKALTFSRMQNLNAALSSSVMRWCYYETVLFGDPSITVKAPDPNLPLLSLDSYSFSDVDGDNDGNINPGEMIRFLPVISNDPDWATAENVSIRVVSTPTDVEIASPDINVSQILPGGNSPIGSHIKLQLPQDIGFGTYNISIEIESFHPITSLSTGIRRYQADIQLTLMDSRFPWESSVSVKSSPIVGYFDNNPGLDVMCVDAYGTASIIGNNGVISSSFAAPTPMNISRSFASGAIDLEVGDDLAFCSRTGDIYASSQSGENIFSFHANTAFLYSPMLADLDGDGYNETIAGGLDGKVYAIHPGGYLRYGFPVDLGASFRCELAAADFNADGIMEIIAGSSAGNLYIIDSNGDILNGFPVQLDGAITGSPTISDDNRIVCSTNSHIYIISSNGVIVSTKSISNNIAGGFAVGDLSADVYGIDIACVSGSGTVYAFTSDGIDLPGFPIETSVHFTCPPLLANLDDDPELEIILQSYENSLYLMHHDGTMFSGFPFTNTLNGATPGTLLDFDSNGLLKFVAGYANGVVLYNLRMPATGLEPWVTYRGSNSRQGSFAATGFVANTDELQNAVPNALAQNYPNPFNPSTTIKYSLANDSPTRLTIYNLKGQKIRELINSHQPKGTHSVVWDGKDNNGRNVASGVYFYRLTLNNQQIERRMLLLK
ncbi:MAG: C25 family cysteine peptidase [Candidatus Cloacimonetes bacterium]|nr:C25 family cysteine peptidase [Candidatus Cloacimonadota bacterium]